MAAETGPNSCKLVRGTTLQHRRDHVGGYHKRAPPGKRSPGICGNQYTPQSRRGRFPAQRLAYILTGAYNWWKDLLVCCFASY